MSIEQLKEEIRIAENSGDGERAQKLREQLNQMSIND